MAARATDMFDGIFDNRVSDCREVRMDGRVTRFARRTACGSTATVWRELHAPWGTHPDYPGNASLPASEAAAA